jgi:hypothetical protein
MLLYHYTNDRCLKRMMDGTRDGYLYEPMRKRMVTGRDAAGLWPIRRFLPVGVADGMPREAFDSWTFALLEATPATHAENQEFPGLWDLMLGYFTASCYRDDGKEIVLLSFDARRNDRAFVIDKAPLERLLYHLRGETLGQERRREKSSAYRAVWSTKTPLFAYNGGFSVPEVIIGRPIAPERLAVVERIPVPQQEFF